MREGPEPRYVSLAEVIALHRAASERTGSRPAPLRSEALLESAVMRPRMAAFYEGADLVRQGVLLAVGISQPQAFVDGNKRAALAATDVFLILNGVRFAGDYLELARQIEAVAAPGLNAEDATNEFETWLRARVIPGSPR